MADNQDRIAAATGEAILDHRWDDGKFRCLCGAEYNSGTEHHEHLSAQVASAVLEATAHDYPMMPRDMVSRGQVRRWLMDRASKVKENDHV